VWFPWFWNRQSVEKQKNLYTSQPRVHAHARHNWIAFDLRGRVDVRLVKPYLQRSDDVRTMSSVLHTHGLFGRWKQSKCFFEVTIDNHSGLTSSATFSIPQTATENGNRVMYNTHTHVVIVIAVVNTTGLRIDFFTCNLRTRTLLYTFFE